MMRDYESLPDSDLLRLVPTDEWAFPEFYRRHFFGLAAWLFKRVHDPELAHGLASESMARAFATTVKPGARTVEYPRAWLFTIARNELSRWRRKGQLETPVADGLGLSFVVEDERLNAIVDHADLYDALDHLSDDEALAVMMGYGEGHSTAEVARAIGRSPEATKKVMQRAVKRLKGVLQR